MPVLTKEQKDEIKDNTKKMFTFLTEQFEKEEFVEFLAFSFTADGQVLVHKISYGQTPLMTIIGALELQKMTIHAEVAKYQALLEEGIQQQMMNINFGDTSRGH